MTSVSNTQMIYQHRKGHDLLTGKHSSVQCIGISVRCNFKKYGVWMTSFFSESDRTDKMPAWFQERNSTENTEHYIPEVLSLITSATSSTLQFQSTINRDRERQREEMCTPFRTAQFPNAYS